MNPVLLAQLIAAVGQVGLPLVEKLLSDIRLGKTETTVTPEDVAEVSRLAHQTAAEIFARSGVALPPPAGPTIGA